MGKTMGKRDFSNPWDFLQQPFLSKEEHLWNMKLPTGWDGFQTYPVSRIIMKIMRG
jgi:hypothetical protein